MTEPKDRYAEAFDAAKAMIEGERKRDLQEEIYDIGQAGPEFGKNEKVQLAYVPERTFGMSPGDPESAAIRRAAKRVEELRAEPAIDLGKVYTSEDMRPGDCQFPLCECIVSCTVEPNIPVQVLAVKRAFAEEVTKAVGVALVRKPERDFLLFPNSYGNEEGRDRLRGVYGRFKRVDPPEWHGRTLVLPMQFGEGEEVNLEHVTLLASNVDAFIREPKERPDYPLEMLVAVAERLYESGSWEEADEYLVNGRTMVALGWALTHFNKRELAPTRRNRLAQEARARDEYEVRLLGAACYLGVPRDHLRETTPPESFSDWLDFAEYVEALPPTFECQDCGTKGRVRPPENACDCGGVVALVGEVARPCPRPAK